MPIVLEYDDKFDTVVASTAWAYCENLSLDFGRQIGSITYAIYRNKTAAYSNRDPISRVQIAIGPEAQPAVYGTAELISAYVPPVYETQTVEGEIVTVEIAAAIPPVYGEAPLISAEIPAFATLVGANQTAYGLLLTAVDNLALTRPEFKDAVIEPTV